MKPDQVVELERCHRNYMDAMKEWKQAIQDLRTAAIEDAQIRMNYWAAKFDKVNKGEV